MDVVGEASDGIEITVNRALSGTADLSTGDMKALIGAAEEYRRANSNFQHAQSRLQQARAAYLQLAEKLNLPQREVERPVGLAGRAVGFQPNPGASPFPLAGQLQNAA